MATSTYSTVLTVSTGTTGALSGDGSTGNKLAVQVDNVSIDVNGSNQLEIKGGITTTITTASLVGKTITVTGGAITGFA